MTEFDWDDDKNGTALSALRIESFTRRGFSGETQMKKKLEEQPKRVIPAFATEAEQAEWWYKNRNIHGEQLLAAVKNGEA